jgi:hypothetical protein
MLDCLICLWNEGIFYFDDREYSKPPLNTKSYKLYEYTGYNHVINPNSFNPCYVCNDCLLFNIYCCDEEIKYICLQEIKKYSVCLEIIKTRNIPNQIFLEIMSYVIL